MAIFSEKWLFLPFFAYFGHFGRFWLDFPGQGHFLLGARHLLGGNRLKMAILLPPPGGAWGLLEPSRILRLVRKEMAFSLETPKIVDFGHFRRVNPFENVKMVILGVGRVTRSFYFGFFPSLQGGIGRKTQKWPSGNTKNPKKGYFSGI